MSPLSSTTLRIGDQAPLFTLHDLDGRPFELADVLQGGGALLIFGPGTWSRGTRRQVPEIELAHEKLEAAGITALLIVTEDARRARGAMSAALNGHERAFAGPLLSFPILTDEHRQVARDYGLFRAFSWDGIGVTRPAVFLIGRTGEIRFMYVGRNDGDVPDTETVVWLARELLAPPVETRRLMPPTDRPVVRDWDRSALPRISKDPCEAELAKPEEAVAGEGVPLAPAPEVIAANEEAIEAGAPHPSPASGEGVLG